MLKSRAVRKSSITPSDPELYPHTETSSYRESIHKTIEAFSFFISRNCYGLLEM